MAASLLRLLAITLGVLILTVFAVVFVRWMALHQGYQTPPHAWFEKNEWILQTADPESVCAQPLPASPTIIYLSVKPVNGVWMVPCKTPVPLHDVLERSPQADWVLRVDVSETMDLDKLVETVEAFDKTKRFAIHAPAQKAARYVRKLAPQWLYAADSASLLRLHVFQSLFLEPALDFWPDFVIASLNREDGSRLTAREVSELHRRGKRVLWNRHATAENPPFPVDGELR